MGGISLVAPNFIPNFSFPPAPTVSIEALLKNRGGGLLITILGIILIRGGSKSITTRRVILEDEYDRKYEKRGCAAILNGLGQVFFGLLLLTGGLGMFTLAVYQQLLPMLGF